MALVIGHKGAPTLASENRVASFERAVAVGSDGVELDVRRSGKKPNGGSDELVVWHDATLPDGRVLADTPRHRLDGDVDDLTAVLDATIGLALVNIEIKNFPHEVDYDADYGIADAVAEHLAARPPEQRPRFVVSSFHLPTLERARARLDELSPEVRTGWLLWGVGDVAEVVADALAGGHRALHPHHSAITAELVEAAHRAGLTVNTWTCNDPDRIRWLAEIGTDGIITDVPEAAKQALLQLSPDRGQ